MESKSRTPTPNSQEKSPCPICRGEGQERRWRYDERTSVLEEVTRPCAYCGGSGNAPPRIDVRPDDPTPGWAWEMGSLT